MADLDRRGDLEVRIVGTDGQTEASVTSTHRLQIIAQLEAGANNPIFALQSFVPYINYNASGSTITPDTYTSLLNISGEQGKLDFIAVACGNANYQIKLAIDSVTVYDISMAELNTIGLANAINVDIWAEVANKNFRYRPQIPIDFNNSVDLYAKSTVSTSTVYHLVTYRFSAGD